MIKGLDFHFSQKPQSVRLILCLAASIFLPLYITVPMILFAGLFLIRNRGWLRDTMMTSQAMIYVLLSLFVLVVPLVGKNYIGFLCGIALIFLMLISIYIRSVMTDDLFKIICNLCCVLSLISAMIALAQQFLHLRDRVTALTNNANYYAYIVELMVIVCFYLYSTTKKRLPLVALTANLSALIFTGCRSAWIALLIGLYAFNWIIRNKKYMYAFSILALILFFAVYFYPALVPRYNVLDDSLTDRFHIWSSALNNFLRHPLFGRGILAHYQLTGSKITPHAHNIYLDLLESAGIVGTSAVIVMFGIVLKQLVQSFRMGDEQIKARVALCGGIIAVTLIHGITDAPVIGFQTGLLFVLLLSIRPKAVFNPEAVHRKRQATRLI